LDVCRDESECSREIHKSQIKIDIPTNERLFCFLVKSPEEGGTYFENTKIWQMALSRDLADLKNT
jgi:hypothetical protein